MALGGEPERASVVTRPTWFRDSHTHTPTLKLEGSQSVQSIH